MFTTLSLTADLVRMSDIPACLSTVGREDSRYLAANAGYLKLIERVWAEIAGQRLISAGAAIASSQRDRRRWLLDTQGHYDSEPADIRTATGRSIKVRINSQRLWCSGTACDIEYFEPVTSTEIGDASLGAKETAAKAKFSRQLEMNFMSMSIFDKEIFVRRILSLVTEGLLMAEGLLRSTDIHNMIKAIIERVSEFRVPNSSISTNTSFDFSGLEYELVENLLLEIAGEIWLVITVCQNPQVGDMLKSLVAGYAIPRPIIIR